MSASKYLAWCLSLTFLVVTAAAVFNYVADPCGIYHFGKSWDWIPSRPELFDVAFIHKAQAVQQANADVLFMGSSRSAEGLDPHGPDVPPHAYNLGLPSSSIYEQRRYLQHAIAAHPPQTLVLGVDWDGFAFTRKGNALFSEDRLLVRPDGSPTPSLTRTFADVAPTLFSLSTLTLSWNTLWAPKGSELKFDGGYEAKGPLYTQHLDLAKSVFAANKKWVLNGTPVPFRAPDGSAPEMGEFSRILTLCAENHIRLIVFVQPLHTAIVDKYTDQWDTYCAWLKELVARTESTPALQSEFWDFAGYNSMSTEPFPLPSDKYSHMHFYWEGSHYRKIVGDMVLRRVFTGEGPVSFGRRVTSATVDQDLQRLLEEKRAWHEQGQCVLIESATAQVGQNQPK